MNVLNVSKATSDLGGLSVKRVLLKDVFNMVLMEKNVFFVVQRITMMLGSAKGEKSAPIV
jgi:hypothetical protein